MQFQFNSPTFGGNPFNSSHLLSIATLQRPEEPRNPTTVLTPAQQFARQLESRLLASLSSGLVQAITGSAPGTTGEFVLGDQRITFERTLTEIRVTIFNELTNETTEIVVPVLNFAGTGGGSVIAPTGSSAESVLSTLSAGGASVSVAPSPLESGPLETPLGSLP